MLEYARRMFTAPLIYIRDVGMHFAMYHCSKCEATTSTFMQKHTPYTQAQYQPLLGPEHHPSA